MFVPELGEVFVDGSVVDPTLPLARAAYAALQLKDGRVVRGMVGTVPPGFPRTADIAEHLALLRVSELSVAELPVVIVSGCASAVRAFDVGARAADDHRSPHAGIWRRLQRTSISKVLKVKAHSPSRLPLTGEGQLWLGNFLVDLAAKDAARN